MNDLAQAVAFLESLNLAHGDLRPENILLDRDRLKLSDFDYTAEIGTDFKACIPLYGRILNSNETNQGQCGTSSFLGPRTEQFALSSLYYLINYGFEVYRDQCLTEDPNKHGPQVVDLLQNMEFPKLDGDPLIDDIISKCWHNKYSTIAQLAAHTQTLLIEGPKQEGINAQTISTTTTQWRMDIGRMICGLWGSLGNWRASLRQSPNDAKIEVANSRDSMRDSYNDMDEDQKKAFCQDLEKRGLLHFLSSAEPEQLGFTLKWYRHTS